MKTCLLMTTAAASLFVFTAASTQTAQFEEVVITAQRVEENLQKAAISISAY